jgi:5-methylcytosine-specific restriction endonuclease McrA
VNGQQVFVAFNCGDMGCPNTMTVPVGHEPGSLICATCGHVNGPDDYLTGDRWKFCVRCERMKPRDAFDIHRGLSSGRQSECRACKVAINRFGNPVRTQDQLRESSEGRRLFGVITGDTRVSIDELMKTFSGRCFKCGRLVSSKASGDDAARVDHTLPARYLWPLSMGATLLCTACNGAKRDRWPSEFYDRGELKQLAVLTGIPFALLAGSAVVNPEAVLALRTDIDQILIDFAPYPEKIRAVRNLVLEATSEDILASATTVPDWARDP